ncbi:MAG: hypothetical protein Q9178_003458 [Gyalolechia marmorata]
MSDVDAEYVVVNAGDARQSSDDSTDAPQPPHIRAKIQKWLCPTEYAAESSDYNKHRRSYCPNTGEWLRQSSQYLQWYNDGKAALWVNGIPGSGKSVVAASLVYDLYVREGVPVLYFFFRYANLANRTPKQMVRDWLSQLLDYSSMLQSQLKDLTEKCMSHESVTFKDLWTAFCLAAAASPKIYCVADALDEMEPGNEWFLLTLAELGQQKPSTLKLLLTSRQSPHIERVYKEPLVISVNLDRRLIDHDIVTYIHHLLSNNPAVDVSTGHTKLIERTVQSKANGLFIYARLMMDEILANLKITNIEALLGGLPSGMDDMYTTLLNDHSKRSRITTKLQMLILQWITHATRPLRLLEVAELIRSVSPDYESIQETKITVRSACGPLLTVLPDETLQVIHHSFTEFLINTTRSPGYPVFDAEEVHTEAAVTSIGYIVSCSMSEKATGSTYEKKQFMHGFTTRQRDAFYLKYPLLQYATSNWMVHASKSRRGDPLLMKALDHLFAASEDHFAFWLGIWHISGQRRILKDIPQPLHIVSLFGLIGYAVKFCDEGTDVNTRDSSGRTPLSYACDGGHQDVIRLLLDRGASSLITSRFGVSPLHYACASNRPDLVQLLLEAGADPLTETICPEDENGKMMDKANYPDLCDNRRRFGTSALQHGCTQGHVECVQAILESLPLDKRQLGPLHWAAEGGKVEVTDLILKQYDGNPNAWNEKGNTPLCLAARQHSPPTVRCLLDAGASVFRNSTGIDKYYRVADGTCYVRKKTDCNTVTPLHAWALGCSRLRHDSSIENMTQTAKMLIEAGCDVNAKDTEGKTPLFYWITYSGPACSAFLEVLLSHGADAAVEDTSGCTPLHLLRYNSAEDHIRTLLSAGGDMNKPRSIDGRTPLMCALEGWSGSKPADWSEYVAKYRVDPNAQDQDGKTVLHHIMSSEGWTVGEVHFWLQAGANPRITDEHGRNCLFRLYTSYSSGRIEDEGRLIKILTAAGLDLNSTDHQGCNVILSTCCITNLDKIQRLKEYGVNATARDHRGATALHLLLAKEISDLDRDWPKILEFFLDQGVDLNGQDHSGDTMLHVALGNPTLYNPGQLVDSMLQRGADIGIRNYRGQNVVHVAASAPKSNDMRQKNEERALDLLLQPHLKFDADTADHYGETPLHLAAMTNVSRVRKLLRVGSDITSLNHQGRSVLHYAARANNSNVLGLVLQVLGHMEKTNLLHHKDHNGRTALHDAVRSGSLESVQILLDSSADPNVNDNKGRRPLHIASEIKEEQMLRYLRHSTTSEPVARKNSWGRSSTKPVYKSQPAHLASRDPLRHVQSRLRDHNQDTLANKGCGMASRTRDIVRALLGAGANPRAEDVDGSDALQLALNSDSKEVFVLLSSGTPILDSYPALVEKTDRANPPEKMKVQRWKREHAISALLAQDLATTPEEATTYLMHAINDGSEEMIEAFLDLGADPLHVDEQGFTTLHLAVSNGLLTITRMLIRRYDDLGALPSDLFHKAARREECNLAMIKLLIQMGCDTSAIESSIKESRYKRKEDNLSVIHVLATGDYWWQPMALACLLSSGANIEAATSRGRTALQLAIRGRLDSYGSPGLWRKEAIGTLLDHGAKINFVDTEGKTPLIEAFEEGAEIVKTLILHGADVNFGPTPPIGHAVLSGNVDAVQALLQGGADVNTIYNDSSTTRPPEPILLQAARGCFSSQKNKADCQQMVELLLDAGADVDVVSEDRTPLFISVVKACGIISPFLSRGIDMEIRDAQGMPPILAACAARCPDVILQRMIEAGANPLAVDYNERTAIHHIVANISIGYREEFKRADLLLAKGVPVDALDTSGRTALHCAVAKGRYMNPPVIKRLLEAGANPSVPFPDAKSRSMLHLMVPHLAEGGQTYMAPPSLFKPLVKHFLNAGLDMEARDSDGNTPIFGYVARQPDYDDEYPEANRHPDLDEQRRDLLEYNIRAKNSAGEGLLHIVAKRSRDVGCMKDTKDMFKLLWELGLDPQEEDGSQRTPLDVAAACGNTGILDLFAPKQ